MNSYPMFFEGPGQPDNPSDHDRYQMAYYALLQKNRPEDLKYIFDLMSPPADISSIAPYGAFKGIRVGIIGAGLAGLSAAFELRKLGFDITVVEAMEDRIGGRVYTYYFNKNRGLYGELGPMRIPVTHETVWHYIKRFKLSTRPFIQTNENNLIYLRNARASFDPKGTSVMKNIYPRYRLNEWERNTSWQSLLYYGQDSHLLCASPEIRSEILQVKMRYHPYTIYLDNSSNRQMFKRARLSDEAVNLLSNLSPLAGENLYYSYIDYIEEVYPVDLAFLYEIPGGMANLPEAFRQSLVSRCPQKDYPDVPVEKLGKVRIRQGCWVTDIRLDSDKAVIGFKERSKRQKTYEAFDYVLCAAPLSSLRNIKVDPLFHPLKMQAIKEVNYTAAQKTIFLCNKRFWEEGGPFGPMQGGGSFTDKPITTLWYPSDHAGFCERSIKTVPGYHPVHSLFIPGNLRKDFSHEPGVMIASYNFHLDTTRLANLPVELRFEEIKREVEEVHGLPKGYLDPVVTDFKTMNWDEEPSIRGALCFFAPGQKSLYSYAMAYPEYNQRIFFAGDYTSAVHRWMQGALQSGMCAANQLLKACKCREG